MKYIYSILAFFLLQAFTAVTPQPTSTIIDPVKLLPIVQDKKWGYIDQTGKIIIPPQYDKTHDFVGETAAVQINKLWGFINKTGKWVIPALYDDALSLEGGFVAVKQDKKWGVFDKAQNKVLDPIYDYPPAYSEGFFRVHLVDRTDPQHPRDEVEFLDMTGKPCFNQTFWKAGEFKNGRVFVSTFEKEGGRNVQKCSIINTKGECVFKLQDHDPVESLESCEYSNGYFITTTVGCCPSQYSFEIINQAGKTLLCDTGVCHFSDGYYWVEFSRTTSSNGEIDDYYFLNSHLENVFKTKYLLARPFSEGLAFVTEFKNPKDEAVLHEDAPEDYNPPEIAKGKSGFINGVGKMVIEGNFNDADQFKEGLCLVQVDNWFGFIDKTGKFTFKNHFLSAESFDQGIAKVYVIDLETPAYINTKGEFIWPPAK